MEKCIDYIELVKQAQLGENKCSDRLAEAVRQRLYAYVYRYTLKDDLTNDIVQESILKMFEAIGKLREVEQFWPWLYKIARNKIHHHYRKEQNHVTISDPDMNPNQNNKDNQEVIAGMLYDEFKEAVFAAMRELKPEHRSIIHLRCYDQMQYSEIAETIGRSEFAAQKLFYRAKKSLKKKLVRRGLGKGSLPMALVIFGKLTAPTEAMAAKIIISSATIKVGTAALVAAILASKTAVISLITAAALTAGGIVAVSNSGNDVITLQKKPAENAYSNVIPQKAQAKKDNLKYLYHYPAKTANSIMMRVETTDTKTNYSYCKYLQNADANYYFDHRKNTVHINNHRQWQKNLSVWQLPTDSSKLTAFISQMQTINLPAQNTYIDKADLSAIPAQPDQQSNNKIQISRHHNVLGEDYFKYDWPADAKVVDNRDVMHKRGWTYFKVTGQIDGKEVKGSGRLPFVYATSNSHWPWMKLRIDSQAYFDRSFIGLSRPWTGLHTIDIIRRDAAKKRIPFETKLRARDSKAQVILKTGSGEIIYTINMEKDIVEQIVFTGDRQGLLAFDYLADIDNAGSKFPEPNYNDTHKKAFNILSARSK